MQNCKTVRRRAQTFIQTLIHQGIKELPLSKAKTLFSQVIDLWDRTTIKAYFGTQQHKSTRKLSRLARYGTGTYSFKHIELSQEVKTTEGYFQKLGLAEITKRGKTWFFLVNQDAVIVPQLFKEVAGVAASEISLSQTNSQKDSIGNPLRAGKVGGTESLPSHIILETNNNLQSEREKTDSCEPTTGFIALELTSLEKPISGSVSKDG